MALTQKGDESITVSTSAIGFTASEYPGSSGVNGNVQEALVYVEAGGPIRWNASQDPTAGGSEGSPRKFAGNDPLRVIGQGDLKTFRMILDTGGSSATVRVVYFGGS